MTKSLPALAIGDISVRQLDGLYSLNDLHKASGGADKHQPAKFIRLDQTQELIAALDNSPLLASFETTKIPAVKTKEGRNGGTYAAREVVIAYAAWINATFHLKVIRVFLDTVQAARPFSPTTDYEKALDVEKREAASFALAQSGSRAMLMRKGEKKALVRELNLMREVLQLRLALGFRAQQAAA